LHLLLPWGVTLLVLHCVTLLHCSAKAGWAHAGDGQLVICRAALALELSVTGTVCVFWRGAGGGGRRKRGEGMCCRQMGVIFGGSNVTRRHIRHTSMALPTGMELAETLRWGKLRPPSVV
jgi:hypothetical protein